MSDTFRKEHRELNEVNKALILSIKRTAEVLEILIRTIQNREMSLAITNLEQCTMWATKGIVLDDERKSDSFIPLSDNEMP